MSHYAPWQQPAPQGQPAPAPPKRRTWLWAGLAVAAVLGICGIGSCVVFADAVDDAIESAEPRISSTPDFLETPPPAEQAATENTPAGPVSVKVGDTLTVTGDDLEIRYTLTKVEQKTRDRFGLTPDHGVYLLVHLRVDVIKGDTFACSCELAYIDKQNRVYEPTYPSFKGHTEFESADVAAGQHVDGWIAFDVPKPTKGGKVQLTLQNFWTDNEYGYWQL